MNSDFQIFQFQDKFPVRISDRQGAFSQIEKSARPQAETLSKLASVMGLEPEHLTLDD